MSSDALLQQPSAFSSLWEVLANDRAVRRFLLQREEVVDADSRVRPAAAQAAEVKR